MTPLAGADDAVLTLFNWLDDIPAIPPQTNLVTTWLIIGRANPWIAGAWDPPFAEQSFVACESPDDLADRLAHGNWSLGQSFYIGPLCFIQQVDGGDEWMVIRGSLPFDSYSAEAVIRRDRGRFLAHVAAMLRVPDEQLRSGGWLS